MSDKKERPILFNSEMVRSILDGRKTQTRRVAVADDSEMFDLRLHADLCKDGSTPRHYWLSWLPGGYQAHCTVDIGDVLWVRETFRYKNSVYCPVAEFKDGTTIAPEYDDLSTLPATWQDPKWRPNIHMPRWAARLFLKVTGIRVERAQDITTDDIAAEGVDNGKSNASMGDRHDNMQRLAWIDLWDSVAKPGAKWIDNPWVWVIEFEMVKP